MVASRSALLGPVPRLVSSHASRRWSLAALALLSRIRAVHARGCASPPLGGLAIEKQMFFAVPFALFTDRVAALRADDFARLRDRRLSARFLGGRRGWCDILSQGGRQSDIRTATAPRLKAPNLPGPLQGFEGLGNVIPAPR
jgi:hypothetical protein